MRTKTFFAVLTAIGFCCTAEAQTLEIKVIDQHGQPVPDAVAQYAPDNSDGISFTTNQSATIVQRNTQFQPFTSLIPVGAEVVFKNEDNFLHHVFSFSKAKRFDLTLFGQDETRSVTFERTGVATIGCNIHDGMIAHIFISDAPFAGQSGHHGSIKFENVPTGKGQLVVWHPLMRQRDNRILKTINFAGEPAVITISSKFRKGLRRSSDY